MGWLMPFHGNDKSPAQVRGLIIFSLHPARQGVSPCTGKEKNPARRDIPLHRSGG